MKDFVALGLTLPWLCVTFHQDLLSGGLGPFILISVQVWVLAQERILFGLGLLDVFIIGLGGWFLLTGFHPLTALLGMFLLGRPRLNSKSFFLLVFSMVPILVPLGWLEWTHIARQISLTLLDGFLILVPGAERVGVSLFFRGEQLVVLSSCSGATLTRLLLVLSGLIVLIQGKGLWKIALALPLGLTLNAFRIFMGMVLLPFVGQSSFPIWDQILGITLLAVALWFLLGKEKWNIRLPLSFRMVFPLLLIALVPFISPGAEAHDVDHLQWKGDVTVHRFIEERSGINRFLIDHPLEACLAVRGYDLDSARSKNNQIGKTKTVKVIYRVGDTTCGNRSNAILHLLKHPGSWREPIEVEVWIWG